MLHASLKAVQQFRKISFGVSVHWGLYSILGRGAWVMHEEKIPISEYEKLTRQFNPTKFDADLWISLIKKSGAKFFLITTKHHDGFSLYDTSLSDYKVTNTPFGRDILKEIAEACHRQEIGLHFYYSLLDWHHPGYRSDWLSYLDFYQGQIRELCTNYGKIDGFLFDGYWPHRPFAPNEGYFLPGGDFDLGSTYNLIHSLQPDALVGNNHHIYPLEGEDYQIWELDLPGKNTFGLNTTRISELPRVSWFKINTIWSYSRNNSQVKSKEEIKNYIKESNKHKATCILNIGPTPEGEIIPEEKGILVSLA